MSDKLTKEQIRAHLKSKWKKSGGCIVCGDNAWIVVEEEHELPLRDGQRSLALAVVICEKCGAVLTFSKALIVG